MDNAGNQIDAYNYGSSTSDVSWAREPDFTGNFVLHTSITANPANYSAGGANTSNAPLPITLATFTATAEGSLAQLHWRTATELNNDYMAVEHSTDGRRYMEIGRVTGAGTTQIPQDYYFTHTSPAAGLNYYRLRQVDYDGQFEYHGPVSLRFGQAATELEVFPTVVSEELNLRYNSQLQPEAVLYLHSADGQLLRRMPMPAGSAASLQLSVADLPAGLYLLRLQNGRELLNARFIKP